MLVLPPHTYHGSFFPCFKVGDRMSETQIDLNFMAVSDKAALEDFCRFVIRMFKQGAGSEGGWAYVGCIRVERLRLHAITATGHLDPIRNVLPQLPFAGMEWKYGGGLYQPKESWSKLDDLLDQIAKLKG